ncbi:MAG: prepilin-type N-terminal cleavage/methylation domain-containing protein, partial [FCB group bacterium]|nr:prepilin-type N-terminal cleavage/methylation domain-containing protein [FCB group bacterium]
MKKTKYIRFQGFTLVEVTAAIALLTIMLLGSSQYLFHSRRQLAEANLKHDAWMAMSDRMEYALALDYDVILDSTLLDDLLVEQDTPLDINGNRGFRTTEVDILYTSGTFNGDGIIGSDENACMYCGELNRPAILSMTYTGDDCSLTHSSQSSGMVSCSGDPQFASPVEILATNSSDPADPTANIWFDGYVAIDSSFNINAYNAIQDHLDLDTYVHILDVSTGATLQTVKFHTSCSEPLYQNDQFGSTVLTRFISELGVDVCGIGNNGDDVTISSNPGGGAGGAGLSFGHFDLDTTDGANTNFFEIGNGKTDQHTHQYDDKYNVVGIDFFNLQNTHVNLLDAFDQTAKFKIIILNSHLSEGGRLVINGVYNPTDPSTYQSVVNYAEAYTNAVESIGSPPPASVTGYTDFSSLPVYSLDGEPGTTQLTNIGLYFNVDAIANAQPGGPFNLHPTNTGDTRKNMLGPDGEWRNGALTVWAVEVNPDGTDNFQIDMSSGHPHIVSGLLWEGYLFWHWEGPSFHEPGWITFDPGDPGIANQNEGGCGGNDPNGKVAICHIPGCNPQHQHTIMVSPNAVNAPLGHGCSMGACSSESCGFCDDEHTKPARLTLKYTGDYCDASHHSQEDKKVSCTD